MIYWGQKATENLEALVTKMKDPRLVASMFTKFDKNRDGGIVHMRRVIKFKWIDMKNDLFRKGTYLTSVFRVLL